MICEVMAAEVTELCGPKHAPSSSDHYRAGSSSGRILYEGQREEVVRPRVRLKSSNGTSQEVELTSYRVAKDPEQLRTQIVQAIATGVNSRGIEQLHQIADHLQQLVGAGPTIPGIPTFATFATLGTAMTPPTSSACASWNRCETY